MAKKKNHTHTKKNNQLDKINLFINNLNTKYLRIRITDNPFVNPLLKDIKIWNTSLHKKGKLLIISKITRSLFQICYRGKNINNITVTG